MGKVRTRIIGLEDVEDKQKKEQKARAADKKVEKKVSSRVIPSVSEGSSPKDEKSATLDSSPAAQNDKKEVKKSKQVVTKSRTRGKKYTAAKAQTDPKKVYSLDEALKLLKKIKFAGFDESVELHLNLNKSGVKGEAKLPNPTGKQVRIKIVDDKVLGDIEKGKIDFEILVSHPSFMPKLARFAKILGPRGLMPSPKSGTISDKPEEVAKKFSGGSLMWKSEAKSPLLHLMVAKSSHEDKKIAENIRELINSVGKQNIEDIFVKTTMSPSIKVDLTSL